MLIRVEMKKEWLMDVLAEYFKWEGGYKIAGDFDEQFSVFSSGECTDDCGFEIRTANDSMDCLVSFFEENDVEYLDFLRLGPDEEVIITNIQKP